MRDYKMSPLEYLDNIVGLQICVEGDLLRFYDAEYGEIAEFGKKGAFELVKELEELVRSMKESPEAGEQA